MAAEVCDSDGGTGFSKPLNNSCAKWQPPPRKHCIAQVTGGLGDIYTKIESGWQSADEDFSKCIDEDNFFQPNSKGGLLAGRYQVIRILGRGNSSTILQAQDTFRSGLYEVAIKVLKPEFYRLGYQESHLMAELNKADSHNFCGIVRLLNTFTLGSFFCMTFELLRPWPLHQVFKKITDKKEKLVLIRKVALRMLQILGFLGQQNVIHADLKPENILCNSENVSDGIKVIDFGNAIHGVYEELSLYYDEFELQTLLYRAPEVLLGLPFGQEIDMWSLGCILAELYLGKPLFWAKQKEELLSQMTSLFGPLPTKVYQRAKFFTQFKEAVGQPLSFMDIFSKFGSKLDCNDFKFVYFLQGMLTFDPSERMSISEAIQHPFMGPELAIRYLLPFKINGSEASSTYPSVDMTPSMYTHAPAGTLDSRNKHLTSLELLHHGTRDTKTTKQKVVHVVAPFELSKSKDTKDVSVKVEPKSEPGGDVGHGEGTGDIQLPEAHWETIQNPIVPSVPELMEQAAPVVSKISDHHLPQEPLPRKDTYKKPTQSLKIKQNPLVSQQVVEVESDSKPYHAHGKAEHLSEPRKHMVTPPKDDFSHQQTLKEPKDSAGKSKLKISEKRASVQDVKTERASESPGKADHQFRYLNQHRKEAVTHKSKSLGINMKKLQKSPVKLLEKSPVSYSKRKEGERRKKSEASSNKKKNYISSGSKGMLICDDKKSIHPRKDVTLMVDKDQQKRLPRESNKHSKSTTSSAGHKDLKHEDGTSVYDFVITPEKKKKPSSRKRSLQLIDDSVVKRTRTKRTTSEMIVVKDQVTDDSQGNAEKCTLKSLNSNSPCSGMKQSDAGLSSSESSSEQTSLLSKMHFLSRLQAAGDNKLVKPSMSPSSGTPTSSSSTKSSLQNFKRWSLDSSPLSDQLTKTASTSERKTDAKITHGHSIGRNRLKQRDIPLSSSPSSATSSSPNLIPSSLHPLSSSHGRPSQLVTKQTSPALQIKRLFGGPSSRDSSSSQEPVTAAPKQQRRLSPQQRVKASSKQQKKSSALRQRKSSPKERKISSPKQQRTAYPMQQRKISSVKRRKASPLQRMKVSPKHEKEASPKQQRKVSSNVQGQITDITTRETKRQDSPSDDDDEILLL